MRSPFGAQRERLHVEVAHQRDRFVARAFERVDAQIERRARGERRALLDARFSEHAKKMRIEPFRIIARDMRRRAGEIGSLERGTLGLRQRGGRKARTVERPFDRCEVVAAFELEHADEVGARRRLAHREGARRLPAQRVIDQARDRGAVGGAGEAALEPPFLERIGGRPARGLDLAQDLDGG